MAELEDTYAFLQQIRRKETEIRRKQLQHDELQSCLLPGAIRYDVDKVQSTPEDPMGKIFAELDDLERQIADLKAEKARLINVIAEAIEQLADEFEKTVLAEFYIGRRSMGDVAKAIDYSPRRAYYFRKQGVIHLDEIRKSKSANIAKRNVVL